MPSLPARLPRVIVDTSGLRRLGEQLGPSAQRAALDETVATMDEVGAFLERQTVLGTPVNTGALRGGWTHGTQLVGPGRVSAYVGVQGPGAAYALPTELGSRPHWPPSAPVELYVRQKGFAWTDRKGRRLSVKSMAFLIRRKIATRGGRAFHMAQNAVDQGWPVVNEIVERRFNAFVERLFR